VATQRGSKNGSLAWEDEASAESRFRRVQQVSPPGGRTLPGMPLEMPDPEDDDLPRRRRRYDTPSGPWYRPDGTAGRVFLGLAALTVLGAFTTGFLLLKHSLERDARFRIAGTENIQAAGLSQVSRADILPVFGEDIGKSVFFIHLSERRKQLEQIPWIEHATVMRLLPDRIRVSVVERMPIAFVREAEQIGLVDANGVLLSMPAAGMTRHHYSFPVVTGLDPRDPLSSRRARMAVYQRLIADLDSGGQHFSAQISEIDLTDPEDARVLMPEQGGDILAHFGDEQFLTRYQRYKAHIAEWRQQYPRLAAVDLRYDTQVVLEMAPGSGAAQTAVNAGDGKPAAAADGTTAADANPPSGKPAAGVAAAAQAGTTTAKPQAKTTSKPAHKVKPHGGAKSAKDKKKLAARRTAAIQHHLFNRPAAVYRQGQ
jgi:cell division protein FtsQ